jgi:hypothetical protein
VRPQGAAPDDPKAVDETPPPRAGWPALYALVLGFLIAQILIYTWFTIAWR